MKTWSSGKADVKFVKAFRDLRTYLDHPTGYLKASTTSTSILKSILRGPDPKEKKYSRWIILPLKFSNQLFFGHTSMLDLLPATLVWNGRTTGPFWFVSGFSLLPAASSQSHSQPRYQHQCVHPMLDINSPSSTAWWVFQSCFWQIPWEFVSPPSQEVSLC